MLLELPDCRTSVSIVSLGNDMALVDASDGVEHLRVYTGVIVAGKAAGGLDGSLLHSATM